MERQYTFGAAVIFVDSIGQAHPALVTRWWQGMGGYPAPGCNVVYCSSDEKKTDDYGRQTERATSVCHKSVNPAHGNYWIWPDEA